MGRNLLMVAIDAAKLGKQDRTYYVGACCIRRDGALIKSFNGWPLIKNALHHAESRLVRKLDMTETVYVARVKKDGCLAMAKPCVSCVAFLRSKRVEKVIYTIDDNEYGVMYL